MKSKLIVFLTLLMCLLLAGVGGPGVVNKAYAKTVELDWNDNIETDLAGYNVYQSTVSNDYVKGAFITTVTESTATVEVTVEGTYFWVVTAFDTSNNESGFSNEVTLTYDLTPPDNPTGLQALWQMLVSFFKRLFGGGLSARLI